MSNADTLNELRSQLNSLLKNTDLSDVTSESAGFSELPDGYYNCEVEKATLKTSKSSGAPMAAFQFKVSEDGVAVIDDEAEGVTFKTIKSSKGRKIFINYVLNDEKKIRRFVTDMLKFEGDTAGESLLPKEAFTTAETIEDAISVLVSMRIYIQVSTSTNDDGSKSTWNNPISWKRVASLGLPM